MKKKRDTIAIWKKKLGIRKLYKDKCPYYLECRYYDKESVFCDTKIMAYVHCGRFKRWKK